MKALFAFFAIFCSIVLLPLRVHSQIYSDVTFVGSVHTGSYSAVSGISAVATNGGYYTNAVATTNCYRLSGTNAAGRLPLSTNILVVWTPGTGTNAVQLSWTRAPGINRHVIEKSLDAGATWTNWLDLAPSTVTWLDTGSNTWTATMFTNLYSQIPAGTYPWSTPGDLSAHTAAAGTAVHGLGTAASSNVEAFATAAQGAKADTALQSESDTLQTVVDRGNSATNVGALTMVGDLTMETNRVSGRRFGEGAGSGASGNYWQASGYYAGQNASGNGWGAFGDVAGDSASGGYWGAFGNASGGGAVGDQWGAFGFYAGKNAIHTNSHVFGCLAGCTARGNNRMYLDVYATDPNYSADGATNDTIFMDSNGTLYLGGGAARAENPSAGGVLRGSWNLGTGSASTLSGCPSGATPIPVSPPASNSAAGATGQWAVGITGGTNFVYFYDPDGGGATTGRWLRIEGNVTW